MPYIFLSLERTSVCVLECVWVWVWVCGVCRDADTEKTRYSWHLQWSWEERNESTWRKLLSSRRMWGWCTVAWGWNKCRASRRGVEVLGCCVPAALFIARFAVRIKWEWILLFSCETFSWRIPAFQSDDCLINLSVLSRNNFLLMEKCLFIFNNVAQPKDRVWFLSQLDTFL